MEKQVDIQYGLTVVDPVVDEQKNFLSCPC